MNSICTKHKLCSQVAPALKEVAPRPRLHLAGGCGRQTATRLSIVEHDIAKGICLSTVCRATKEAAGTQPTPAAVAEPTVEEVMNPDPIVLSVDMPIKEAVRLLLDKDVSGAPVVDKEHRLVGILSESDLIWKGAGAPQDHFIIPPVFIGFADAFVFLRDNKQFEDEVHKILAKTVGEAMTANPASVSPGTSMSDAATLMLSKKVNRLPVVENGKVVGVITRHDILRGMYASHNPLL